MSSRMPNSDNLIVRIFFFSFDMTDKITFVFVYTVTNVHMQSLKEWLRNKDLDPL